MELLTGTFERIVISPVGPIGGVIAVAAFPVLYAISLAGLMLVAAAGIFGFPIHLGGIPAALAVSGLAALAFTCIGLLFIGGLLAFKSAMGASWAIAGLSILGGVYFPLTLFPGWLRWAADVQPFTPAGRPAPPPPSGDPIGPGGVARGRQAAGLYRDVTADLRHGAESRGQCQPAPRHAHGVLRLCLAQGMGIPWKRSDRTAKAVAGSITLPEEHEHPRSTQLPASDRRPNLHDGLV